MPTPSKFTESTKKQILDYLRLGASRKTAAHASGTSSQTLSRWVQEGEQAAGGAKRKFYEDILEAESQGSIKALRIVSTEMENNPNLAWRYLERREPAFAPPVPQVSRPSAIGPVNIEVVLPGNRPLPLPEPAIDGEVIEDESDSSAHSA